MAAAAALAKYGPQALALARQYKPISKISSALSGTKFFKNKWVSKAVDLAKSHGFGHRRHRRRRSYIPRKRRCYYRRRAHRGRRRVGGLIPAGALM